jgi:flagellar biosynthesis protein FlhB
MAEQQEQNRSEKPTAYKLGEARKKGQVAKSIELPVITGLLMFLMAWEFYSSTIAHLITFSLRNSLSSLISTSALHVTLADSYSNLLFVFAEICLPILVALLVTSVVTSIFQVGWIWTTEPLQIDFNRLNFIEGIKKLFTIRTLFDALKAILKLLVVGVFIYIEYEDVARNLSHLRFVSPSLFRPALEHEVTGFVIKLIILLAFIALLDYFFVRWNYQRQMMMSTREIKDEYKKKEGDPDIRNKRKKIQNELLAKLIGLGNVKNADVVVTNPTHIAIALKYNPTDMLAPKVIIASKGFMANRVRELAIEHSVMIIQDIALARQLYATSKTGDYISVDCFEAVSKIYKKIWKTKR